MQDLGNLDGLVFGLQGLLFCTDEIFNHERNKRIENDSSADNLN